MGQSSLEDVDYVLNNYSKEAVETISINPQQAACLNDRYRTLTEKDHPGHDLIYSITSKKIEKELGWKREYSFNKGIKETVNWYMNNI